MIRSKLMFMAAAVVGVAGLSSGAGAATVSDLLLGNDPTETDTINDFDGTYLVNRSGGARTLDVGDSLRGMFVFDKINSATPNLGTVANPSQLTAVYQLMVVNKTPVTGGFFFEFAADPTFGKVLGSGGYASDTPGAVSALYEDATTPAVLNMATKELAIATATDGTRFWTVGFSGNTTAVTYTPTTGGPSVTLNNVVLPTALQGYSFTAPTDNVDTIKGTSAGTTVATAAVAFDRLGNGVSETGDYINLLKVTSIAAPGKLADFVGTINLLGARQSPASPFDSLSNAQLTLHAVPLPSAAWAGLGMLGCLFAARMRRIRA